MGGDESSERLRLRPLSREDEDVARAAHAELSAEGVILWPLLAPGMSWPEYLVAVESNLIPADELTDGGVRGVILAAEVDGTIVGRSSIRYPLNAFLAHQGGHIAYAVLPAYRRRGTPLRSSDRALRSYASSA